MTKKGYQEKETEIKKRKRGRFIPWLNKLPQEIAFDIFSRLTVESLLQCKRVLRSWNTLISDPHFVNAHLLHASQQQYPDILVFVRTKKFFKVSHVGSGHDESVKSISLPKDISSKDFSSFVVSCNGLLAFLKHDRDLHKLFVDIWNPYTKKRTKCPSVVSSPPWNFTACGFGYDPILNEYKVVALFHRGGWQAKFEAVVCTIGMTSWRHIKEVPFRPFFHTKFNAVHLNGTVYWCARSVESILGVGSFRIRDEKFGFVAFPSLSSSYIIGDEKVDLSMLGGDLCFVDYTSRDNVVVWALMKHSGGDEVWTKQYVLTIPKHMHIIQLLYAFDNGEILLRMGRHMADHNFVYYDPKDNRYRDNETLTALLSTKKKYPVSTFVHVGSLVSPPHTG